MPKKIVRPEIRTLDKETGELIVTPAQTTEDTLPIDNLLRRGFRHLFFKTPWNHDSTVDAKLHGTSTDKPTLTQQHQAEDTDINVIMKRFGVTGTAPGAKIPPSFMDVPADLDMQKAIDLVKSGQEAFESQPATVRAFFRNDLARYVGYVDERRRAGDYKALQALGLDLNAEPKPPAAATEQVQPPKPVETAKPPSATPTTPGGN